MAGEASRAAPDILRQLTLPMALAVAALVAAAWYVTWSTADLAMALMAVPMSPAGTVNFALFFALIIVMMVAMMLPAAIPMIIAFHGITRLEGGRPTKPADSIATAAFVAPYFIVWGAFGVAALLGLMALGLLGQLEGASAFLPAAVLVAAGAYQATRTKEVCLRSCQSPTSFVLRHWRGGRLGAVRMGTRHALYCLGCCWLFMVALFVAGSMSLLWMGVLSVAIFAEKVGTRQLVLSRAIGGLLLILGGIVAVRALGAI